MGKPIKKLKYDERGADDAVDLNGVLADFFANKGQSNESVSATIQTTITQ